MYEPNNSINVKYCDNIETTLKYKFRNIHIYRYKNNNNR